MDLELVSVESWLPATPADLRANLRRSSTVEDDLLAKFLATATRYVEFKTKTSILGRTLRISFPRWPTAAELPAPPLRYAVDADPVTAITLVRYLSEAGTWTTAPADSFRVRRDAQVWVLTRGDATLPALKTAHRAVQVTFTVGYRSQSHLQEQAPDLLDAIILHASHRDQNREATINEPRVMAINRIVEHSFDALIKSHKVMTRYEPEWV